MRRSSPRSSTQHGLVVDIGLATEALAAALAPLRYRNLDEMPEFAGKFTTTEFLCGHVFDALAEAARGGGLGDGGRLKRIRVTLHESHVGAGLVRGGPLSGATGAGLVRDPGRSRCADRGLWLRPAADRGVAGARLGGAASGAAGRVSVSRRGGGGGDGGGAGAVAGRRGGAGRRAGVRRAARARWRRRRRGCGWWRWCIIRSATRAG